MKVVGQNKQSNRQKIVISTNLKSANQKEMKKICSTLGTQLWFLVDKKGCNEKSFVENLPFLQN